MLPIGNTPVVTIDDIWCKCEHLNPTGSIKDRVAYEMMMDTRPGDIVIEATSGNTGVSVAWMAACRQAHAKIYCPAQTSLMKQKLMIAYGAEIIDYERNADNEIMPLTTIKDCIDCATRDKTGTYLNQFSNLTNYWAQVKMAQEVRTICPDAIVTGIGTGGTLAGLYTIFPNATFYTWDADYSIEGTSDGVELPLKPPKCNLYVIRLSLPSIEEVQKYLATKYGYLVGLSSAANFYAASMIKYKHKKILTIFPDTGYRYLL